jgi:hypothetical protein
VSPTNGKLRRLDFVQIIHPASSILPPHTPFHLARSGDGCERQTAGHRCGLTLAAVALFRPKASQVAPSGFAPAVQTGRRLRHARRVAYANGFFVMLALLGWTPDAPLETRAQAPAIQFQTIMGDRT